MVEVINILKDGTRNQDITGHIVRISDAETVYHLMDHINSKRSNNEKQIKRN